MKISKAQKLCDQSVERILSNWENGNLTDAVEIVDSLPSRAACYVVAIVCERLGQQQSGMFIRRLQSDGLTQMTDENLMGQKER